MTEAKEKLAGAAHLLADTTSQVTEFLLKVVAAPAEQIAGIAEDWLRLLRYKNLLVIRDKVEVLHKERGVLGKKVPMPPKFAIPIVDAASLEEEESLQDLWARLIAGATDPSSAERLHPGFADAIKSMSVDEALIVKNFQSLEHFPVIVMSSSQSQSGGLWGPNFANSHSTALDGIHAAFENWCEKLSLHHPSDSSAYLINLQRIGLVEIGFDVHQRLLDSGFSRISQVRRPVDAVRLESSRFDYIRVSGFGQRLLAACGLLAAKQSAQTAGRGAGETAA